MPSNSAQAAASTAEQTFALMPDINGPEWVGEEGQQDVGKWTFEPDTAMHPFWAVRRIPASTLAAQTGNALRAGRPPQFFNCTLKEISVTVTAGGTIGTTGVLDRRRCTLCGITNTENILKGAELLMQVREPLRSDGSAELSSKRQKRDDTAQAD